MLMTMLPTMLVTLQAKNQSAAGWLMARGCMNITINTSCLPDIEVWADLPVSDLRLVLLLTCVAAIHHY